MVLLQRKLYFSKDSEGGPTFHRESYFFQGGGGWGVQMLISIETLYPQSTTSSAWVVSNVLLASYVVVFPQM